MKKILLDSEISKNLQAVISTYDGDEKTISKELSITPTQLREYVTGKRRAINLSPKLLDLGISSDWYLTGKGEMYLKDIQSRDEKSKHYEEIGKTVHEVLKKLQKQEKEEEDLGLVAEEPKTCGMAIESIPLYAHTIAAGPATDSSCPVEEHLDLPKHMIAHPAHTYAVRASGDSMKGSGIEEGDILIVDTAIEAQDKSIVVASVNGEQTVKRLWKKGGIIKLMPENHSYEPIEVTKDMHFKTQGVVVWVIRKTE